MQDTSAGKQPITDEEREEVIARLTGISQSDRRGLISWLAKQGELTQLEAIKLLGDLAQQKRKDYNPRYRAEFYFSMLLIAVAKMRWAEDSLRQKQSLSEEQTKAITVMRIKRLKDRRKLKSSPDKDLIRIRFFEEISQLRDSGLSWREIASYIADHHNKKISHSYLKQVFQELCEQKKKLGVDDGDKI